MTNYILFLVFRTLFLAMELDDLGLHQQVVFYALEF